MLLGVLVVAGCVVTGDERSVGGPDDGEPEAPLPSPWEYADTGTAPAPALGLAALGEGFTAGLDAVAAVRPTDLLDAYHEALARGDEACPSFVDHNGQTLALGDCAAAGGTAFYGYELLLALDDRDFDFGDGPQHHAHLLWLSGSFRAEDDAGYALSASGDLRYREYDPGDGSTIRELVTWGDFATTSPAFAASWVGQGWGVELTRVDHATEADHTLLLDGAVSGLPGALPTLALDALALDDAVCAAEPVGVVTAWDAAGRRYDLAFGDGDAPCDGCGTVTTGGNALGELCGPWPW